MTTDDRMFIEAFEGPKGRSEVFEIVGECHNSSLNVDSPLRAQNHRREVATDKRLGLGSGHVTRK